MKKIFVGASWKMNKTVGESVDYIKKLLKFERRYLKKSENVQVFVLPTYLPLCAFTGLLRKSAIGFGSQNCFHEDEGAFTGEVSPMHLRDIGCRFVELGHPERKKIFKENNRMINLKIKACLRNNLQPVLCIGEEEKCSRMDKAKDFIGRQLEELLEGIKIDQAANIIFAYEPAWAIGADDSASSEYIDEMQGFIRNFLQIKLNTSVGQDIKIIYGGSVNLDSAGDILRMENNNGIFIGRASLDFDYFTRMIRMALDLEKEFEG